ncbi:MAG: hypothetical protein Q4F33_06530, partial [Mycoplasmatota bacterium]|nr:hypothetical protein [Mycoplasmatota bacterium]
MIDYDITALENAASDSLNAKSDIENVTNEVDNLITGIDTRVRVYFYQQFASKLRENQKLLETDKTNCDNFNAWLTNTNSDLAATISKTEGIANQAGNGNSIDGNLNNNSVGIGSAGAASIGALDSLINETIGGQGNANTLEYTFDPEAFEELPSEVQEVIKTKLKELGFTDDEIKDILDGKVAVSKLELDTLSSELEEVLKANPDIRTKLVELYGFDIFNEDGTINKDRLALAMIMDGKDPN